MTASAWPAQHGMYMRSLCHVCHRRLGISITVPFGGEQECDGWVTITKSLTRCRPQGDRPRRERSAVHRRYFCEHHGTRWLRQSKQGTTTGECTSSGFIGCSALKLCPSPLPNGLHHVRLLRSDHAGSGPPATTTNVDSVPP